MALQAHSEPVESSAGSPAPELVPAPPQSIAAAARCIAETLARPASASVDREARFPREALAGLSGVRLLGAMIPAGLGGLGASLSEIADATEVLARACASTGMIFAMHQIQIACLVEHSIHVPWFESYLRQVAGEQRLIASVTSEVGVGGDLRSSIAAVTRDADGFTLEKRAPTVSYGEHADALLLTARRSPDAPKSDQVLVLLQKPDFSLERTSVWNTLGMRGTCSPGFVVRARFAPEQVLDVDFAEIAARTMVPVSHLLWASVWLGVAGDALSRAHAFVRAEARKVPGTTPPSALRLAEALVALDTLRSRVRAVLSEYEQACKNENAAETLSGMAWAVKINGLKLAASELVVEIVTRALRIIGMAGYREDGDLGVARHLRDAHSAALMISNDRILSVNASLLLVQKELA
jgi:acyl-CoA dehydrogenase